MKVKNKWYIFLVIYAMLDTGCDRPVKQEAATTGVHIDTTFVNANLNLALSAFSADSAYRYTKEQVDFGPRVPGTKAHDKCLQFILAKLRQDSLLVTVQKSSAKTFTGKTFEFENITASSQPNNPARILLCAHWDTRPFADQDSVNPMGTFDGADDGASGVAMLLELARHLKNAKTSVGVDLVFFDIEDYGQEPNDGNYPEMEDSWCLGSQYWAKNIPIGYNPRFGILLDMVGGKNAVFPMEGTSMQYASDYVRKVWALADKMGYGSYFTQDVTGPTTDDHLYINKIANIPTIDIVHFEVNRHDYPYFHHKHSDNMSVIDTATLRMVGRLLINVIYSEESTDKLPPNT